MNLRNNHGNMRHYQNEKMIWHLYAATVSVTVSLVSNTFEQLQKKMKDIRESAVGLVVCRVRQEEVATFSKLLKDGFSDAHINH